MFDRQSGILNLAAVTAVLKHCLQNGLIEYRVPSVLAGDVTVSALSPDRIAVGAEERPQINLFLFQVTPQTHLRLKAEPATQGAIALELHYLLTAYGEDDLETEVLLGYAIQMLHMSPRIGPEIVAAALRDASGESGRVPSPPLSALTRSGLAERIVEIRLNLQFFSIEEMSKLWSALQARYRPSVVYKVSLLLGQRVAEQVERA